MSLTSFIAGMPKAELHVHLEGTLEPSLVRQLAARNNVSLPASLASLEKSSGYDFHDLSSFLQVYYGAMSVLITTADFHDLAYAYLQKCKQQNVVHAEMFFDPQAHTTRGISFKTIMTGLRSACIEAEQDLGVSTALIMCFLRDMSAESAMTTLVQALEWRECIVGVGLDSDERGNPPNKFRAVFERARREGFKLTMHCDVDQIDSKEHIRQCLVDIGVDRIDHGTNVVEDDELVRLLKARDIGLTCCPISNSIVCADFKGKEMVDLLDRGVKVTINSDDPAYFRGYMIENMVKIAEGQKLGMERLLAFQENAFTIAWVSEPKRGGFLRALESYRLSTSIREKSGAQ